MKKSKLYKVGAFCLTFLGAGAFMAFDDAQTDEQKVEAAYEQLVADFHMEQDALCKTQALAAAQDQFAQMNASAQSSEGGNDAPAASIGGNGGSSQSSGASQGGSSTPPPPPPPKEDPKPKQDAQKGRDGGATSGDANSQKGRTGGTTTGGDTKTNANDQKRRGGK